MSGDAEKLIAWLREGADELEKAHLYLDHQGVPRENPVGSVPFTLAARIAYLAGQNLGVWLYESGSHSEAP